MRLDGNYTEVPNLFTDALLPTLTPEVFRILMMVWRETKGRGSDRWRASMGEVGRRFGLKGMTAATRGLSRDKARQHAIEARGLKTFDSDEWLGMYVSHGLSEDEARALVEDQVARGVRGSYEGRVIAHPFAHNLDNDGSGCRDRTCDCDPDDWDVEVDGPMPDDFHQCRRCREWLAQVADRDARCLQLHGEEECDCAGDGLVETDALSPSREVLFALVHGHLSRDYYAARPSRLPVPTTSQPSWFDGYEYPWSVDDLAPAQQRERLKEWNTDGRGRTQSGGKNLSKSEMRELEQWLVPRIPLGGLAENPRLLANYFLLPNAFEDVIAPNVPIGLYPFLVWLWRETFGRVKHARATYESVRPALISYSDIERLLGVSNATAKRYIKWAYDNRFIAYYTGGNEKNGYIPGAAVWQVVKTGDLPARFRDEFDVQSKPGLPSMGEMAKSKKRRAMANA